MYLDCYKITTDYILNYCQYMGERRTGSKSILPKTKGKKAYDSINGLSSKARARIKLAISTLVNTATYKTVFLKRENVHFRYKVNFITLTLPSAQVHSDNEIVNKIFSPFMEMLQKRRKGFLYFWKAEKQDNGNLHFHVTTNSFYHYEKLRKDWNKAVNKLGYIDRCIVENPNSTDVHSVKNIKNLANYMVKYMTKGDLYKKPLAKWHRLHDDKLSHSSATYFDLPKKYFSMIKEKVTCRLWSCSDVLKKPFEIITTANPDYSEDIAKINHPEIPWIEKEHFRIVNIDYDVYDLLPSFKRKLEEHFSVIREKQKLIPKYENF